MEQLIYEDELQKQTTTEELSDEIYGAYIGRTYNNWISEFARSNGHTVGTAIRNLIYIMESIIRDEVGREVDLITDSSGSGLSTINITNLKYADIDNAYAGAYLYIDVYEVLIIGNVGSLVTVALPIVNFIDSSNVLYIDNIQTECDIADFDFLGNTTDGILKDWDSRIIYDHQRSGRDLLSELCREGMLGLFRAYNKYKLFSLTDFSSIAGTLSNPLKDGILPLINWRLSPLGNVYTSFELKYNWDVAKGEFRNIMTVDQNTASDPLLDPLKTLCQSAITKHKVSKIKVYESATIWQSATAVLFLLQAVPYFTDRFLLVTYTGDLKNHIQFEKGDVVTINYPDMIPEGMNGETEFLIYGDKIDMNEKNHRIHFKLRQIGAVVEPTEILAQWVADDFSGTGSPDATWTDRQNAHVLNTPAGNVVDTGWNGHQALALTGSVTPPNNDLTISAINSNYTIFIVMEHGRFSGQDQFLFDIGKGVSGDRTMLLRFSEDSLASTCLFDWTEAFPDFDSSSPKAVISDTVGEKHVWCIDMQGTDVRIFIDNVLVTDGLRSNRWTAQIFDGEFGLMGGKNSSIKTMGPAQLAECRIYNALDDTPRGTITAELQSTYGL